MGIGDWGLGIGGLGGGGPTPTPPPQTPPPQKNIKKNFFYFKKYFKNFLLSYIDYCL